MSRLGLKVLVIGSGGREHALAWKLKQSPLVGELFIAPGNAGTASIGQNVDIGAEDIYLLRRFALSERIDLTIVGPEVPLIHGLTDRFRDAGLKVFGPSAAAARIEGSKAWAKNLMERFGIPTGRAHQFNDSGAAIEYARTFAESTYVLKADGPAAGKGVILPESHDEAEATIRGMIDEQVFGDSGSTVLVEERMSGPEVSVFAFVDGAHVSADIAACDYKRAFDDDQGPNTGGVGAYSPPEFWNDGLAAMVRELVLERTASALVEEGCPYTGVLYAGLMLTTDGPKVIEFNCRFGDPETQVILPLLDDDLAEICLAVATGQLESHQVCWASRSAAAVILTSKGYPGKYETGKVVSGFDDAESDAIVFHAGTARYDGKVLTSAGRVLACVGLGDEMSAARDRAYSAAAKVQFDGVSYRKDIAARALPSK